jgi:phosphatidylinositol-3,4,5-trisphosphate 3-phosphatase/dual-specificity protein phosphatase PTEN
MLPWIRGQVSKKKKRTREEGFDLDLAYIGDRIIAMGYPAQGFEAMYRNDGSEVRDFLNRRHGENYMVCNLCSEPNRQYDGPALFGDHPVHNFGFSDHNPPHFDLIRAFCVDAAAFLNEDAEHIVAVHCKAGKGRTGVMICALLMHMQLSPNSAEALRFYGEARTKDLKGVTIPGQRRYVHYYEDYLSRHPDFTVPLVLRPVTITKVVFVGVPAQHLRGPLSLEFWVMSEGDSSDPPAFTKEISQAVVERNVVTFDRLDAEVGPLAGEIRIALLKARKIVCFFWVCSEFVKDEETIPRCDIDKAAKSKKFDDSFEIKLYAIPPR